MLAPTVGRHPGPRGKAIVKRCAATLPRFDGSAAARARDCPRHAGEDMTDPTPRSEKPVLHRFAILGLLLAATLAFGAAARRIAVPAPTPLRVANGSGAVALTAGLDRSAV